MSSNFTVLALVLATGMGGGGEGAVPSLSNGVISRKYKGNRTPAKMVPMARRVSPMHSGLREPVLFVLSAMGWVGAGATWLGLAMDAGVCVGSGGFNESAVFARRLRNRYTSLVRCLTPTGLCYNIILQLTKAFILLPLIHG